MEEFWHLEYLDNYLCCTPAQLPVLTSAQCRDPDPGHSDPSTWTWSPWSSWGACQRVVTSIEVASVRRRYYLQYLQYLGYLQYLLSTVSRLSTISTVSTPRYRLHQEPPCLHVMLDTESCEEEGGGRGGGCAVQAIADTLPSC